MRPVKQSPEMTVSYLDLASFQGLLPTFIAYMMHIEHGNEAKVYNGQCIIWPLTSIQVSRRICLHR